MAKLNSNVKEQESILACEVCFGPAKKIPGVRASICERCYESEIKGLAMIEEYKRIANKYKFVEYQTCPMCNGRGERDKYTICCHECDGEGKIPMAIHELHIHNMKMQAFADGHRVSLSDAVIQKMNDLQISKRRDGTKFLVIRNKDTEL